MKILDVYTKKQYECKKCNGAIYYAKIANDKGELITTDGKQPNGKMGKESNVVSGAVDATVQDRLHKCTEKYVLKAIEEAETNKGNNEKLKDYKLNLSEQEQQLWSDIISKVCEYDILADKIISTFPCDQSGQSKGRIKNISAQVLRDILEARRNNS